jgi:hypothetical protein
MGYHKTTIVQIGNAEAEIDELIADDIQKINNLGMRTWVSCQGDDPNEPRVGIAYIGFAQKTINTKKACRIARAAGMEVKNNECVYSAPNDHHDAIHDIASIDDLRAWNARFRLFLKDLADNSLDPTGNRYRSSWFVHDCHNLPNGGCIDTALLPAYHYWARHIGEITVLCHGDQDAPIGRPILTACTRWTTTHGIPINLKNALTAIRFEVPSFGVYTTRKVKGSLAEYYIGVTPARLLAMNRTFKQIFDDFSANGVREPDAYVKYLAKQQAILKPRSTRKSSNQ